MAENIKCAECEFARQDKKTSAYSKKRCGKCEKWSDCSVCRECKKREICKVRKSQKDKQYCDRRFETLCGRQKLRWAAVECANPDSEFHRSLLNVTANGGMQDRVTWSGCDRGVRREEGE